MATLEEKRRASGQAMQDARRANGQRIEAERRAIGNRMIEERTGKAVAEDINRLTTPPRQRKTLRSLQPVGGLPASRGRADYQAPANSATAGIASPITEPDFAAREYWPTGLVSSDGLFVLPAVKKVVAADANGAEVIFEYANPVTP